MRHKQIYKNVAIISCFIMMLQSCSHSLYPITSKQAENIGYIASKYGTKQVTSVGDDSFMKITSIGMKNDLLTIGVDYSINPSFGDIEVDIVDKLEVKIVCYNGKTYNGEIMAAKSPNVVFPEGDELFLGSAFLYVKSPKRISKIKQIDLSLNLGDDNHLLSFTPNKLESKWPSLALVDLPYPFGQDKSEATFVVQDQPIEYVPTEEQLRVKQSVIIVNNITNIIKNNIMVSFNNTMDEVRKKEAISDNIQTNVKADLIQELNDEGKIEYNLRVKYGYEVKAFDGSEKRMNFNNISDDFGPGKYKLSQSKAAKLAVSMFKHTVESELKPYLAPGRKVTIKITGTTDGLPIRRAINYDSSFGSFDDSPCFVNGIIDYVTVNKSTGIKRNEDLAYLRTFAVRDFIEKQVEDLRVTDLQYQHFAEVSDEVGGENRKVSLEIIIHEAFSDQHKELSTENQAPLQEYVSRVDDNITKTSMSNPDAVAVVIGNSNYKHDGDVLYAVNDAKTMKKYLVNKLGYDPKRVLLYEDASSSEMKELFGEDDESGSILQDWVRKGLSDVFIYYSGHGVPHWETKEAYLLPIDVQGGKTKSLTKSAYKLEQLYENLSRLAAKNITVVLDACYSGKNIERSTSAPIEVKRKSTTDSNFKNMVVISAARANEEANWFDEERHGVFSWCFFNALKHNTAKGFNDDKELSYQELFDYLNDENYGVPYYAKTQGDQYTQHPTIVGENLNRTFINY